jgi:hypothetical protein
MIGNREHRPTGDTQMPITSRPVLASLLLSAALVTAAQPATAAERVSGRNLLTAEQMAEGSTREGWRVVKEFGGQFDCGAMGVMKSGASDRARRDFMSDADASGFSFAASFQGTERARKAFRRSLAAVRTCFSSSGSVRVRADEEVAGPGRMRLVQLFFRVKCCGSDTHTFGVVRRGSRTAIVKIGEMGRSPVGPMRDVVRAAGDQLTR